MKQLIALCCLLILTLLFVEIVAASKHESTKRPKKMIKTTDKRHVATHPTIKKFRTSVHKSNKKPSLKTKKIQKQKPEKKRQAHSPSKISKSSVSKKKPIPQRKVVTNEKKPSKKSNKNQSKKNTKHGKKSNQKNQPKKQRTTQHKHPSVVMGKTVKAVPNKKKQTIIKKVLKKNVEHSVMPPTQWPEGSYGSKQNPNNYAVFGPKDDRAIQMAFTSEAGKPVSGVFDVITHGFTDGTLMDSEKGKSTPKELAKWILENTNYKPGTPIRLLVCNSGTRNQNDPKQLAMAQQVANALGATVYGANTYVSATDFTPVVMQNQVRDKEYRWGSFEPGKRAKEVPQVKERKLSEETIAAYGELGNDLDAYQKTTEIETYNANVGSPNTVEQSKATYNAYKNKLDSENQYY